MSDLLLTRDQTLQEIQLDKKRIALSPTEIKRLDRRLSDEWGIRFIDHAGSICNLLVQVPDREAAERYVEMHDASVEAIAKGIPGLVAEKQLYDQLANPDIFPLATSERRHLILDALAVAVGLVRNLNLTGNILDVGCHAGFVGSILAEELYRPVMGIDPSSEAITFGRSHPASSQMLKLVQAGIPWDTDARFDFVLAISSMPQERTRAGSYFRGVSNLLNPAGIALIISSYWSKFDVEVTRRQLRSAGLGFGYADLVGGYGGIPPKFSGEGFLVLLKGGTRKIPHKLSILMQSDWNHFQEYANGADTPDDEKVQSYERAKRASMG